MDDFEAFTNIYRALNIHVAEHVGVPSRPVVFFRGNGAFHSPGLNISNFSNLRVVCVAPNCNALCDVHPFCPHHAAIHLGVRLQDSFVVGAEGLFACGDPRHEGGQLVFDVGDYIAPYTGLCLTQTNLEHLYDNSSKFSPYAIVVEHHVVDSLLAMSFGAKANTSRIRSEINARLYYEKDQHPYLFAIRPILSGQEIFFEYIVDDESSDKSYNEHCQVQQLIDDSYTLTPKDGSGLHEIHDFFK